MREETERSEWRERLFLNNGGREGGRGQERVRWRQKGTRERSEVRSDIAT